MTASYLQNLLWVEKYRPKRVQDCVLPSGIKKTFQEMVDNGEVHNLLLSGTAGTGKTTIAKALCEELGCDYLLINCSEDGNIDTLRTKIRNFASTVSLGGGRKVVILDEFANVTPLFKYVWLNTTGYPVFAAARVCELVLKNRPLGQSMY